MAHARLAHPLPQPRIAGQVRHCLAQPRDDKTDAIEVRSQQFAQLVADADIAGQPDLDPRARSFLK